MGIKRIFRKIAELGFGVTALTALLLAGCGGGASSGLSGLSNVLTIVAVLGQLDNGTTIRVTGANGLNGTGNVNASGVASVSIPAGTTEPLLVEVLPTNGRISFYDEKMGATSAPVVGTAAIRALVPSLATAAASGIGVTTLTEMAVGYIENHGGISNATPALAIAAASSVGAIFGMTKDEVLSKPALIGATTAPLANLTSPENKYALKIAALANMAATGKNALDVVLALRNDFQDGQFDGMIGTGASAVSVTGTINGLGTPAVGAQLGNWNTALTNQMTTVASTRITDSSGLTAAKAEIPANPTVDVATEIATTVHNLSPIGQATTLLTSLRTNANLLSNTGKTGFIDTQVSGVKADFSGIQKADTAVGRFTRASEGGAQQLLFGDPTGTTSNDFDHSCIVAITTTVTNCYYREPATLSLPDREFKLTLTDTTPSAGVTAQHSYTWDESVCNSPASPTPGSCGTYGNSQTGTVTATHLYAGTVNGGWADYHFTGKIQPLVEPTAVGATPIAYSSVDIVDSRTISGGNIVVNSGTGTVTTGTLLTLAWMPGTQTNATYVNAGAPTPPVSGHVVLQAKTANYQFDGTLDLSSFAADLAGNWYPGTASFTGSVTNLASAAVGKFMTGTLSGIVDDSHFDPRSPTVPGTNYRASTSTFTGSITNRTVAPAMVYQVVSNRTGSGITPVSTSVLTYTDPSNNTVTMNWTQDHNTGITTPGTITMGGITISGCNAGTLGGLSGCKVTSGATLIGAISGYTVYFVDGTTVSVQ